MFILNYSFNNNYFLFNQNSVFKTNRIIALLQKHKIKNNTECTGFFEIRTKLMDK